MLAGEADMTRSARYPTAVDGLILGILLACAPVAGAAVDMTATWRIDATVGPVVIVAYETYVQSGTTLVMSWPADPPVAFPGTINPATGIFDVQFGPATQESVPEPGPDVVRQGTVAADGLTFTAQQNICIWDGAWGCHTFQLTGTRTSIVCGDGVAEGAELCDLGAGNGGDCCTTACARVDPDGDGVCAALDNCPGARNPAQEDWDGDGLGNPCDGTPEGPPSDPLALRAISIAARDTAKPVSRITIAGDTTGPVGVPTVLRLSDTSGTSLDASTLPAWAAKECKQTSALSLRCGTPDKLLKLTLKARSSEPTALRVRLTLKKPPLSPPFSAPVTFTIVLADGAHTGTLSTCRASGAGIRCKP